MLTREDSLASTFYENQTSLGRETIYLLITPLNNCNYGATYHFTFG